MTVGFSRLQKLVGGAFRVAGRLDATCAATIFSVRDAAPATGRHAAGHVRRKP